jgi:hypothetical protein
MTRSISLGGTIGFNINKLDDNLKDLLSELTLFKSPFPDVNLEKIGFEKNCNQPFVSMIG